MLCRCLINKINFTSIEVNERELSNIYNTIKINIRFISITTIKIY